MGADVDMMRVNNGGEKSYMASATESLLDMVYYRDERMPPDSPPPPYSIRRAIYHIREKGLMGTVRNLGDAMFGAAYFTDPRTAVASEDVMEAAEDTATEESEQPPPTKKRRQKKRKKRTKRRRPRTRRRRRRKNGDRMHRPYKTVTEYHRPMRRRRYERRKRRRRP